MPSSAVAFSLTARPPITDALTGILMRPADTDARAAFLREAA
ncbi:hypothetical protein NB699_002554 [Xanthomonas sacchari]|nr:hypothetical protein [Xanthomonas sacchari]MCW0442651.1 hypothetical protein [Xanthomonas sacchari]